MPKRKIKQLEHNFKEGDIVTWTSQAGGSYKTKVGKIIKKIFPSKLYPAWYIANKYFPQREYTRMFNGDNIPGNYNIGFFIEIKESPNSKPKLYFPNPSLLRKVTNET